MKLIIWPFQKHCKHTHTYIHAHRERERERVAHKLHTRERACLGVIIIVLDYTHTAVRAVDVQIFTPDKY